MPPDMGTELNRRLDCLDAKISDITREMNALKQQMAVLIDRSDREAEHCPYRVDIARAHERRAAHGEGRRRKR